MDPEVLLPDLYIKNWDLDVEDSSTETFYAAVTELVRVSRYALTVDFHRLCDEVPMVESAWGEERWVRRFVSGFVRYLWM